LYYHSQYDYIYWDNLNLPFTENQFIALVAEGTKQSAEEFPDINWEIKKNEKKLTKTGDSEKLKEGKYSTHSQSF